jgi:hypothetical protein
VDNQKRKVNPCPRCKSRVKPIGDKYCAKCRKVVMQEMRDTNYLTETEERSVGDYYRKEQGEE